MEEMPEFSYRMKVRAGITGYAQVHGRNLLTWEERFQLDLWYVQNVSLKTDLKILLDTVAVVLKRDGISSGTAATMEEFRGSEKTEEST